MKYQNDDDDDNMVYSSEVPKTELWHELNRTRDRVRELEHELEQLKNLVSWAPKIRIRNDD